MGAATHVGRVRRVNEDSFLARDRLAVVADGMGGHACGDRASAHTVDEFAGLLDRGPLRVELIQGAIAAANNAILSDAASDAERAGMGTTVTGVASVEHDGAPHWLVFNLGDSRVYRITGTTAVQLTVDHSEVAEMIALGQITRDEARRHPMRNIVTRSLGVDPLAPADMWLFPPSPDGDSFLACSDGLTNELTDEVIGAILGGAPTARDAAAALVAAAVDAGGRDNVTAVVVRTPHDSVATVDEVDVNTTPRGSYR